MMKSPNITTLIFDLGGVLVDWNPSYLYKQIFQSTSSMDWFLENICSMDWNEEQDAGRTIVEANQILIEQYPNFEKEILAYYGRWEEMLAGPIEGTVSILEALKNDGRFRLVALTNWSAETFPIARRRFPFLAYFEGILVSGDEGMKKPDPKIYELLLDRYQIDRNTALFIDDSLKNVRGGEAVGIESLRFLSPYQLEMEFESRGILQMAQSTSS